MTHPLDKLTDEQRMRIAQASCDDQMRTLSEAEKKEARETAQFIVGQYGDVLKRLAKE